MLIPILFQDLIELKVFKQRPDLTKDEKLKTCHRILTACRKGNAEILKLLMQDLRKDDRAEWPKLISEHLFIHHNSLMNSILFQGFNRFSPHHEISKYLKDFAQENGKSGTPSLMRFFYRALFYLTRFFSSQMSNPLDRQNTKY